MRFCDNSGAQRVYEFLVLKKGRMVCLVSLVVFNNFHAWEKPFRKKAGGGETHYKAQGNTAL